MKLLRVVLALCAGLSVGVLSGCGGGGGAPAPPPPPAQTAVSFSMEWPARSAAHIGSHVTALASSLSAVVSIDGGAVNGSKVVLSPVLNRDTANLAAYTQNYTSTNKVTLGSHYIHVDFFSLADAGGVVTGTIDARITIAADGSGIGAMTPNAVITSVAVNPITDLTVGHSDTLTFTAKDSKGVMVAVTPGSGIWTLVSGGAYASMTAAGITNGIAVGQATVNVSVDGVVSPNASFKVVPVISATQTIPAAGGTIPVQPTPALSLNLTFPAGSVPDGTVATVTVLPPNQLPAPITHVLKAHALTPKFTADPGNVYITAFDLSTPGVSLYNLPATLSGTGLPSSIPAGTVLNVAELQSGQWVDIATLITTATGTFSTQLASAALPGILGPGQYLVYLPASGTNTAVSNLGIALIADDGNGSPSGQLQVVKLYDATGNPLATPVLTSLAFSGSADLDGEALTPDGSQGIMVDGGNTLRFFSSVQTGTPVASSNTVNISNYGGDGDSVAIMPNGNEAVVSGDATNTLLLVSGITGGNPKPAATIAVPNSRDGVVISSDGKVLLARGSDGLTVFAINSVATAPGSLGGSVSHTFTQTANLTQLGAGIFREDGRDGIASSRADSSRAVLIGDSSDGQVIQLLTGLPGAPIVSSAHLNLPQVPHVNVLRPEGHAKPHAAITGTSTLYSVAITPDGTRAIVGSDAGLVMVDGVNTGTLSQVGTVYSPSFVGGDGHTYNLNGVTSLGITLDGKYVVALSPAPSRTAGTLLMIPITGTSFGAPVSQLNNVAVPDNDQILMH